MFKLQRIRSAFLAGVLVISILAGTGCKKNDGSKEPTGSRSESSDTIATTFVSDSESSETQGSSSASQETSDPSSAETFTDEDCKEDALKLAKELGVKVAIENCPMLFGPDQWPGGQNLFTSPANWQKIFSDHSNHNYEILH